MESYIDIHTHLLSGVDDGAATEDEMYAMLDMAYQAGTRRICLTPHFSPEMWGDNASARDSAYLKLSDYAAKKYPDINLHLGNELFFFHDSAQKINSGDCKTLGDSKYILVDFRPEVSFYVLQGAMLELLSSGYIPVLAHAERYECIKAPFDMLHELKSFGVMVQLTSTSITGENGRVLRKKCYKILKAALADVVASDAHNIHKRHPCLNDAAAVIGDDFGKEYADTLLRRTPEKILGVR